MVTIQKNCSIDSLGSFTRIGLLGHSPNYRVLVYGMVILVDSDAEKGRDIERL